MLVSRVSSLLDSLAPVSQSGETLYHFRADGDATGIQQAAHAAVSWSRHALGTYARRVSALRKVLSKGGTRSAPGTQWQLQAGAPAMSENAGRVVRFIATRPDHDKRDVSVRRRLVPT